MVSIKVGGRDCENVTFRSETRVTCVTPALEEGAEEVLVEVTQQGGNDTSVHDTTHITYHIEDDEEEYSAFIIASGIAGVVAVTAAVVTVCYKYHEKKRLNAIFGASVIAAEMAEAVAVLDFDKMEKLHQLDSPDRVQRAMIDIMGVMQEFVKYIPPHVFRTVQGIYHFEEDEHIGSGADRNSIAPTVDSQRSNNSLRTPGPFELPDTKICRSESFTSSTDDPRQTPPTNALYETKNTWKAISGVQLKTTRHVVTVSARPQKTQRITEHFTEEFVTLISSCIESSKGCIHRVTEESVVVTWGATGVSSNVKPLLVIKSAAAIAEKGHHCGVYGSQSKCGFSGTDQIQTFFVFGENVAECETLCRAAQATCAPVLVHAPLCVSTAARTTFTLSPFLPIMSSKLHGPVIPTTIVLKVTPVMNKEWMYELEERQDDREIGTILNNLFVKGEVALAYESVRRAGDEHTAGLERFVRWLDSYLHERRELPKNIVCSTPFHVTMSAVLVPNPNKAIFELGGGDWGVDREDHSSCGSRGSGEAL